MQVSCGNLLSINPSPLHKLMGGLPLSPKGEGMIKWYAPPLWGSVIVDVRYSYRSKYLNIMGLPITQVGIFITPLGIFELNVVTLYERKKWLVDKAYAEKTRNHTFALVRSEDFLKLKGESFYKWRRKDIIYEKYAE